MNIKEILEDPRVVMLEESIVSEETALPSREKWETVMIFLMESRKQLLDSLFDYNEENARLLIEFNQAARKALTEMYHRANELYDTISQTTTGEVAVEARCFLGYEYSSIHPVQTQRAKDVWGQFIGSGCDVLYENGIGFSLAIDKDTQRESLLHLLFLDEQEDNWNLGLPPEWSKDMGLLFAFHDVWDHCKAFSLYDLLYVREFNNEYKISIDEKI